MSYRRHTMKPSVALWLLVAVGDVLLIITSAGMLALIALASVVTLVGAAWLLIRRGVATSKTTPAASRAARQRVSA